MQIIENALINLQVNHSPSFTCDSKLDFQVKEALISDTFRLLNIQPNDQKRFLKMQKAQSKKRLLGELPPTKSESPLAAQLKNHFLNKSREEYTKRLTKYEDEHLGNFERIYPCVDSEKQAYYERIIGDCAKLFSDTNATKVRRAFLQRQQMEEQLKKNGLLLYPSLRRSSTAHPSNSTESFSSSKIGSTPSITQRAVSTSKLSDSSISTPLHLKKPQFPLKVMTHAFW